MYILIISKLLLIIAAFNYSMIHILHIDPISSITGGNSMIFGIIILFVVSLYIFNRDYYLPFLGPTVIPIKQKEIADKKIDVKLSGLSPNTTIIYWGSNPSDKIYDEPIQAYSGYGNSGISKTNESGEVVVSINCPSEYNVSRFGMKRKLSKHIHYRLELAKYPGIFSSVKTKYIEC